MKFDFKIIGFIAGVMLLPLTILSTVFGFKLALLFTAVIDIGVLILRWFDLVIFYLFRGKK